MEKYKEVVIDWKFHKSWYAESNKEGNKILSNKTVDPEGFLNQEGILYQIYCDSHLYGQEVLAYIGITTDSFIKRFKQHLNSYFSFANNLSFRVGLVENKGDLKLEGLESILIANHKPFFNKEYLHYLDQSVLNEKYIIINNGNHGALKNACTNYWWVQ